MLKGRLQLLSKSSNTILGSDGLGEFALLHIAMHLFGLVKEIEM